MKKGNRSFQFSNIYLEESAVAVGPLENKGPLNKFFDYSFKDNTMDEDTWEKSEINLLTKSIDLVNKKIKYRKIDLAISGDLINQNVITNYTFRNYDIPLLCIYGACSTSVLSIITAANLIESNNFKRILACSCSHHKDSERQFRYPNEYGGFKPETLTYTVTGSASAIISRKVSKIKIAGGTYGRVIDANLNNPLDMGRAMAPAAYDTFITHLKDFNRTAKDYDLILTGDLSKFGKKIFCDCYKENKLDDLTNYEDCGLLIYDTENQNVFSGGSGCACCGVVMLSYIKELLLNNKLKRVLIIATGALLNPLILNQKETIPAIAHAVILERNDLF